MRGHREHRSPPLKHIPVFSGLVLCCPLCCCCAAAVAMSCSLQRILKVCQAIVGLGVVVLGIWNFLHIAVLNIQPVVLNLYFIFFGLLLSLAALKAHSLLRWFPFLSNWFGVGLYQIWLGFLCINSFQLDSLQTWIGLIAVVAGVIGLIVHCARPSSTSASQPLL
jgi:hypothetical protein